MEEEVNKVKKIGAISILGLIGGYPVIGSVILALQSDVTEAKKDIAVQETLISNLKESLLEIKLDMKEIKTDIRFIRDKVKQ